MDQRLSLITLGVSDLARARAFYEALGWQHERRARRRRRLLPGELHGRALWSRERLAEDSGVEDNGGWGGITLAYNTRSPEEVDAVIEEARARGRRDHARAGRDLLGRLLRRCSATPTATRGRSRTTRAGRSSDDGGVTI